MLTRFLHQKQFRSNKIFSVLFLTPLIRKLCMNRRDSEVNAHCYDWLTVVYV